ncbi:MAG: hypothetical protein CM1200mP27_07540 [Chloroflexota bacterium]|nr:MAG: hypothetical protein CM1200mP27_07540 [Chloroflexota bacterium]
MRCDHSFPASPIRRTGHRVRTRRNCRRSIWSQCWKGPGGFGWGNNPDLQSYLTAGSFEIFKSLQLDMGYDIEFHAPGGLQAIHTTDQWEYTRDRVLTAQEGGYHAELLTTREARTIEPEVSESLLGFMFLPKRGRANPTKTTVAFAAAALSFGAQIETGQKVTDIKQKGCPGHGRSKPCKVNFRSKTLALAAGAWSRPL